MVYSQYRTLNLEQLAVHHTDTEHPPRPPLRPTGPEIVPGERERRSVRVPYGNS